MELDWLISLFTEEGIAHTILLYAFVIAMGVMIGKVKFFGVSLGVTFVLFVGILVGHLGFSANPELMHFMREFGLILFIYSIGLQVGPGFFSSFKKGGMQQNLLAASVVLLGVGVTISLYYIFAGRIPMSMFVGILSGAVTNTPGLGAAQEALRQLFDAGQITEIPQIALGYAVAYPLGVTGIIFSLIIIRVLFKVNMEKEHEKFKENSSSNEGTKIMTLQIHSKAIHGKNLVQIRKLIGRQFVISRLFHEGEYSIPKGETVIHNNDIVLVVAAEEDAEAVKELLGDVVEYDWKESEVKMISRRIVITRDIINGKTLGSLRLRALNVNCTRVIRSGFDLFASEDLVLQVGDRVVVVGSPESIKRIEEVLGNTLNRLNEPHLITLFIGIFLGIIFGSIPFFIPGMPMPVKLGLAGGPLVVAILLGRFGFKLRLITYTTQSANLLLREIGITLFLASVGIASGGKFVETVVHGDGLLWVACGVLITMIPLLIVGIFGRKVMKMNYYTLMGLLAGSTTDPPALAYANATAGNDAPAVAYSTVYPLTMFLRVILAQILILAFV
ncbi:MAG: putative transporter [Paludibacter sp.]|jgi:putative transport protein|nr:putative transporter [Paludibacter sp.]